MDNEDFDRDPAVTLQLRSLLRPPAEQSYWDGLEARIMARVRSDESGASWPLRTTGALAAIGAWWEPFAQWRRIGGMAAAAALGLTLWGLWQTSDADRRLADEAAVEALSIPLDSAGRPLSDAPREKTVPDLFRY
jgi:hypothetical protein